MKLFWGFLDSQVKKKRSGEQRLPSVDLTHHELHCHLVPQLRCPKAGFCGQHSAVHWHSGGEERSRKNGYLGFSGVAGILPEYGLHMTGNVLWCVQLCHRERFQSVVGDFYQTALWSPCGLLRALLGSCSSIAWTALVEIFQGLAGPQGIFFEGVKRIGLGEMHSSKAGITLFSWGLQSLTSLNLPVLHLGAVLGQRWYPAEAGCGLDH